MKKLAIGCGIVVLVLGAGAVVGSYVLYNKAKSYLGNFEALTSFQKFADSVENRTPFTPPASDELTADRMKRFAAVQDAMRVKMGPRFDQERPANAERPWRAPGMSCGQRWASSCAMRPHSAIPGRRTRPRAA